MTESREQPRVREACALLLAALQPADPQLVAEVASTLNEMLSSLRTSNSLLR